jgi:FkbM family methyltransferase
MKILDNGIAVVEGDSHISRWVEQSGRLDHDEYALPIILEHVPEGGVVVDGGAFIGDHTTAYLKKVGRTGKVMAFEPNKEAFECLKHNCPDAECYYFGLSDLRGAAGMVRNENVGATRVCGGNEIILVRLDDYFFNRLDFIKLDVEGMEIRALRGAMEVIKRFKPVLWVEVNVGALEMQGTSEWELKTLLEGDLGYRCKAYPEEGAQYDLLCVYDFPIAFGQGKE